MATKTDATFTEEEQKQIRADVREIMDAAAAQLHDKLNGALAALDPARIESGLDEALDGVRTLCDPAAYALRLAVPVERHRTLSASISASVRVTAGDTQVVPGPQPLLLGERQPQELLPQLARLVQIVAHGVEARPLVAGGLARRNFQGSAAH